MGQLIKVSIIMGVFNPSDRDRFLRAVASLIGQTFSRWDLILYDDGSDPAHQPLIRG